MTIILHGMNYDYILESDFSDLCMERIGIYLLFRNKRFVLYKMFQYLKNLKLLKCFVGTFHWAQTFYLWRVDWRKTSLVCQHFSSSIQFEILWCHQEDFEQLYVVKMDVLMVQYVFFLHKYFIYLCIIRVKLERFTCDVCV